MELINDKRRVKLMEI